MRPDHQQRGYTLLELIISMFIIGIIASLAIPSYVALQARSKIAAGYGLTADPRRRIEEIWSVEGRLAQTNEEAGYTPIDPDPIPYIARVEIVGGSIEVQYAGSALIKDGLLVVTPLATGTSLRWNCISPNLPLNLLPKECQ